MRLVHRVPPGEARREHVLRDLIAAHPQILPVHDLDPSYGPLVTVTRELSIPGVGFVDILLMDASGRLVVVECKLWRNPQARREVVGQILDYARELSRWGYEDLQRQVSIATRRQGNALYALACAAGGTLDEAVFVDRVTCDLAAGRFLLLVVGDGITEGTRRIGEYLTAQPGLAFTFGLIEIAQYNHTSPDGTGQLLVQPRVLAHTALIERHVIRSEVPGVVLDTIAPPETGGGVGSDGAVRQQSGAGLLWRSFFERFLAQARLDDPGQPPPRSGGTGWIRDRFPATCMSMSIAAARTRTRARRCVLPVVRGQMPLPNFSPIARQSIGSLSMLGLMRQPGRLAKCRCSASIRHHRFPGPTT